MSSADITLAPVNRLLAINADGGNPRLLSNAKTFYTRGFALGGGSVVDWLPERDGAVLMSRIYLPDVHLGSHIGSSKEGLGVDLLDTRNLQSQTVEPALAAASQRYISDGQGTVRVMELNATRSAGEQDTGSVHFRYRRADSHEWQALSDFNLIDRSGFMPYAVDRERNVAFGVKKVDGRMAIVAVALDGSVREELIYASPDVDVDGADPHRAPSSRGRRQLRDRHQEGGLFRHRHQEGLPMLCNTHCRSTRQCGSSTPAWTRAGCWYLRAATPIPAPITSTIARRTSCGRCWQKGRSWTGSRSPPCSRSGIRRRTAPTVPGYLTMPPGRENAKGLPAIVMPHGGPDARDEWGFDWLAQFYAARGFAVLQPNFRGSGGYGDDWYQHNGFQSWPTAIGDVLDAGRWLVSQGIAAPGKVGIVGWSYGGYAALQAAVTDPSVFKAVVAIAPVTDLEKLKEEWRNWSNYALTSEFIGEGPQVRAGSPARNAEKIKVPVLLFHGALDRNVSINESRLMASSLQSAGVPHELVTWDDLDHQLDDSNARAQMLRKSEAFLRQAFGE